MYTYLPTVALGKLKKGVRMVSDAKDAHREDRDVSQTEIDLAVTAAELNAEAEARETGEEITQEQYDAAVRNTKRVAKLRKSEKGKCRVIGVDGFNGEDWVEGEYDTPKEALAIAEKLTEQAKASCTDASIATIYYAYTPDGTYLGGNTWKPGEHGGLANTDEEDRLAFALRGTSPLDLRCKMVTDPSPPPEDMPGLRKDMHLFCWFQHPNNPDVFALLIPNKHSIAREWYRLRPNGHLNLLVIEDANAQEIEFFREKNKLSPT